MTILTASTADQIQLTELQKQSCILNGFAPNEHVALTIPKDYFIGKNPSWFRIRALLDHLHNHDLVLWMDSDAMMLRPLPEGFFSGDHMLYLAKDQNGWNHGIACYRNTPRTRELLWRIYDSHWKFRNHPWHEQGCLHTIAEQYDIKEVDKAIFNAYESDRAPNTSILHLPGKSYEYRYKHMTEELLKLQAR